MPSWRWVTGISSGESSAETTLMEEVRAATILLSGRWKAGLRLEIMFGVRTRTDGLGGGGLVLKGGAEWRSGRKVWSVRIGVRRRVLKRSERVDGVSVESGADGYVCDGIIIKERSEMWWGFAPWKAIRGLWIYSVNLSIDAEALSGCFDVSIH